MEEAQCINRNYSSCALEAAKWIIDQEQIVFNFTGSGDVVIGESAIDATEAFVVLGREPSIEDNVVFGCLACRRSVKLIELDDTIETQFM